MHLDLGASPVSRPPPCCFGTARPPACRCDVASASPCWSGEFAEAARATSCLYTHASQTTCYDKPARETTCAQLLFEMPTRALSCRDNHARFVTCCVNQRKTADLSTAAHNNHALYPSMFRHDDKTPLLLRLILQGRALVSMRGTRGCCLLAVHTARSTTADSRRSYSGERPDARLVARHGDVSGGGGCGGRGGGGSNGGAAFTHNAGCGRPHQHPGLADSCELPACRGNFRHCTWEAGYGTLRVRHLRVD